MINIIFDFITSKLLMKVKPSHNKTYINIARQVESFRSSSSKLILRLRWKQNLTLYFSNMIDITSIITFNKAAR